MHEYATKTVRTLILGAALGAALEVLGSPTAAFGQGGDTKADKPGAKTAAMMEAEPEPGSANIAKDSRLALQGYDPVAYFEAGGGAAHKGDEKITSEFGGAVYRFASAEHKKLFDANPAKYEPALGGWCAGAMQRGSCSTTEPGMFLVKDGRLLMFSCAGAREDWQKGDQGAMLSEADRRWGTMSGKGPGSLAAKLLAMKKGFEGRAPADVIAKFNGAIKSVADTGVASKALAVGAEAPEFALTDILGKSRSLKGMLADGPVVVTFYRGGWCPFCTAQLSAYQKALDQIKGMGAQVVAISPQTQENSRAMAESIHLDYAVLADPGNAVAKKFGVSYVVPESVSSVYKPLLLKANGEESGELPLAATYVIGRDGRIAYAYLTADYRERAETSELLKVIRTLK